MGKLVKADLTVTNASRRALRRRRARRKGRYVRLRLSCAGNGRQDGRGTRRYSRRDQGYAVERGHGLRRRRSSSPVAFAITRSLFAAESAISRACFIRLSRLFSATTARRQRAPLSRSARARRPLPCSVATLAHGASRKSSRRKASVSRGAIPSSAKWEANISTGREASENGSPPALVIGG